MEDMVGKRIQIFKRAACQEWEEVGDSGSTENTRDSSDCAKNGKVHSLLKSQGNS
jgi:hypothetical protein